MTEANPLRHILVLPDRDAAEELAGELVERYGLTEELRPVREALAGEDDAEDAPWLLVLEPGTLPATDGTASLPDELDGMAAEYEGWLERE